MIPADRLNLSLRHADVLGGSLATEMHGDEKVAFIDLKFRFLLKPAEIDKWCGVAAYGLIFDESEKFRMPGLKISAELRKTLSGKLTIEVDGAGKLEMEKAHVVGTVSKLSFKIGGHGEAVMQLRVEGKHLREVMALIERGDCMIKFVEATGHNLAGHDDDANEGNLPV